jgi:hypothetical protein
MLSISNWPLLEAATSVKVLIVEPWLVGIRERTIARGTEVQLLTAVGIEDGIVADGEHLSCPGIERNR